MQIVRDSIEAKLWQKVYCIAITRTNYIEAAKCADKAVEQYRERELK